MPRDPFPPQTLLSPANPETDSLSVVVQELDVPVSNMPPVVVSE